MAQEPSPDAWKTSETLGNIDLSGLTPVQKKAVLKILREERLLLPVRDEDRRMHHQGSELLLQPRRWRRSRFRA